MIPREEPQPALWVRWVLTGGGRKDGGEKAGKRNGAKESFTDEKREKNIRILRLHG